MIKKVVNKLIDLWIYFRRGHGVYLSLVAWAINFVVIQHRLFISSIPEFLEMFPNIFVFGLSFLTIYGTLATVIGYFDYKRGSAPKEAKLISEVNPWISDLAESIVIISEGTDKNEKVRALLDRWINDK